jgi:hypothetical protein
MKIEIPDKIRGIAGLAISPLFAIAAIIFVQQNRHAFRTTAKPSLLIEVLLYELCIVLCGVFVVTASLFLIQSKSKSGTRLKVVANIAGIAAGAAGLIALFMQTWL